MEAAVALGITMAAGMAVAAFNARSIDPRTAALECDLLQKMRKGRDEVTSASHLNLDERELVAADAEVLAGILSECSDLKRLDLDRNQIGDRGLAALARCLSRRCVQLQVFNCEGNQVGDAGASALAAALQRGGATLEVLSLSNNAIGDAGAAALSKALTGLSSLATFGLSGNPVGEQGLSSLAAALAGGAAPRLEELHVSMLPG